MSKIKQLALTLFVICVTIISCKKESLLDNGSKLNPVDLKLSQMIARFKNNGRSHLKSVEKITIDSTVWYLEATANFTYGDGSKSTGKVITDSILISLPVDQQQEVNINDVWSKYEQMIDSIRTCYQKINDAEKQLIAIDVKVASLTESNITLHVTPTFAVGPLPTNRPCDFDNTTSYVWWSGCFPFPGYTCPTDAAEEIEKRIMWCRAIPYGNYWYEDVEVKQTPIAGFPNPNWPGIPNYYEYMLFYNTTTKPNCHGVLSPEECNFYLNGMKWVIYTQIALGGYCPPNKSFVNVDVFGDGLFPIGSSAYFHKANITYGVLHVSPYPPEEL
jgi:hypothetical protein